VTFVRDETLAERMRYAHTLNRYIELLTEYREKNNAGDHYVIMAKDEEGNGYSPYSDISPGGYVPDSTYSGEQTNEEDHEGVEWPDYAVRAVFLWPAN
jgi:hypothetical protein